MDRKDISKLISVIESDRINTKMKLSFILYVVNDNMRYTDIASILNIPLNTVKTHISRARSEKARSSPAKFNLETGLNLDEFPMGGKWAKLHKKVKNLEIDEMASIDISFEEANQVRRVIKVQAKKRGLTYVSKYSRADNKLYFKLKRDFKS